MTAIHGKGIQLTSGDHALNIDQGKSIFLVKCFLRREVPIKYDNLYMLTTDANFSFFLIISPRKRWLDPSCDLTWKPFT